MLIFRFSQVESGLVVFTLGLGGLPALGELFYVTPCLTIKVYLISFSVEKNNNWNETVS